MDKAVRISVGYGKCCSPIKNHGMLHSEYRKMIILLRKKTENK